MKPLPKPPHEMTTHPTLGPLAKALNAVSSDWLLLQHGDEATWLNRLVVDLEHAQRAVEMLQRRQS